MTSLLTELTAEDIDAARDRIYALFKQHCRYGKQTKELPPSAAACGQYLGDEGYQRGLHGTAAALDVLASRPEDEGLAARLVEYVATRGELEQKVLSDSETERDARNVIKIGELLFALRHASSGDKSAGELIDGYMKLLRESKRDAGWGFFLDEEGDNPAILPTLFAVRGLDAHNMDVGDAAAWVYEWLLQRPDPATISADSTVQVAALYILATLGRRPESVSLTELRSLAVRQLRVLESAFSEDAEMTVGYSWKGRNFYVRIPWQLYLAGTVAHFHPGRLVSSSRLMGRLADVVKAVKGEGFRYASRLARYQAT